MVYQDQEECRPYQRFTKIKKSVYLDYSSIICTINILPRSWYQSLVKESLAKGLQIEVKI